MHVKIARAHTIRNDANWIHRIWASVFVRISQLIQLKFYRFHIHPSVRHTCVATNTHTHTQSLSIHSTRTLYHIRAHARTPHSRFLYVLNLNKWNWFIRHRLYKSISTSKIEVQLKSVMRLRTCFPWTKCWPCNPVASWCGCLVSGCHKQSALLSLIFRLFCLCPWVNCTLITLLLSLLCWFFSLAHAMRSTIITR